jgi:Mn-containing catalase
MGVAWTAGYLKISGQLEVDLRNDIAAEARDQITCERLLQFCEDPGSKDALTFLMTREIARMKAFMPALESLGQDPLEIGLEVR